MTSFWFIYAYRSFTTDAQ